MSVPVENLRFSKASMGKSEEIWQSFDAKLTKFVTKKLWIFVVEDLIRHLAYAQLLRYEMRQDMPSFGDYQDK
ncbi:hypothetical protein SAMN04515617_10824 [Collimonas sp. OK242]|jgi:hypothetical protein|nr:hypothetical protein SAMN04515617_10824 [Collimonas sp. OK242]